MKLGAWKTAGIAATLVVLLVGGQVVLVQNRQARAHSEWQQKFEAECVLARKEGLPITPEEFAATIQIPKPEENAAPYYLLIQSVRPQVNIGGVRTIHFPTLRAKQVAQKTLSECPDTLKLIDEGAKKPHCWFNRDWSQAFALLMPDFAYIKTACRLKLLRGSFAASQGNAQASIKEAAEVSHVADQLREEPQSISLLMAEALDFMAIGALETWAYYYPDQRSRYLAASDSAIRGLKAPDLKAIHRPDLAFWLKSLEDSQTPEGRKIFGLREGDTNGGERLLSFLEPLDQAKVDMVHGWRDYWRGLSASGQQREDTCATAMQEVAKATFTSPELNTIFQMIGQGPTPAQVVNTFEARRMMYTMANRALSLPRVPSAWPDKLPISTLDGKPVRYRLEESAMFFNAGLTDSEDQDSSLKLKIPSDAPEPETAVQAGK